MELIIKIPDKAYEVLKNKAELDNIAESIIANGTPLPKGHGRLIDAKDVDNHIIGSVDLRDCPTIVEADESEDK